MSRVLLHFRSGWIHNSTPSTPHFRTPTRTYWRTFAHRASTLINNREQRDNLGEGTPKGGNQYLSCLLYPYLCYAKNEYEEMSSSPLLKWGIVALLNFFHVPSLQLSSLSGFEFVRCHLPFDLETLWVANAWSKSRLLLRMIWYNGVCYDLVLNETWRLEILFSKTQKQIRVPQWCWHESLV